MKVEVEEANGSGSGNPAAASLCAGGRRTRTMASSSSSCSAHTVCATSGLGFRRSFSSFLQKSTCKRTSTHCTASVSLLPASDTSALEASTGSSNMSIQPGQVVRHADTVVERRARCRLLLERFTFGRCTWRACVWRRCAVDVNCDAGALSRTHRVSVSSARVTHMAGGKCESRASGGNGTERKGTRCAHMTRTSTRASTSSVCSCSRAGVWSASGEWCRELRADEAPDESDRELERETGGGSSEASPS